MSDQFNCPKCGTTLKILPLRTLESAQDASFSGDMTPPTITGYKGRSGGFWASSAVNDAVIGLYAAGGVYLVCWVFDWPGAVAVVTGFVVGVGSHLVRIVLYAPPRSVQVQPQGKQTRIAVEQVSGDGRHWVLKEFDPSITLEDLQAVARAVQNWGQWSRGVTTRQAHLSQGKHNKLQDDLVKLWYIEPLPNGANGYNITRQGKRFFEAVTSLPR